MKTRGLLRVAVVGILVLLLPAQSLASSQFTRATFFLKCNEKKDVEIVDATDKNCIKVKLASETEETYSCDEILRIMVPKYRKPAGQIGMGALTGASLGVSLLTVATIFTAGGALLVGVVAGAAVAALGAEYQEDLVDSYCGR